MVILTDRIEMVILTDRIEKTTHNDDSTKRSLREN